MSSRYSASPGRIDPTKSSSRSTSLGEGGAGVCCSVMRTSRGVDPAFSHAPSVTSVRGAVTARTARLTDGIIANAYRVPSLGTITDRASACGTELECRADVGVAQQLRLERERSAVTSVSPGRSAQLRRPGSLLVRRADP